jgi:hypothetical protein
VYKGQLPSSCLFLAAIPHKKRKKVEILVVVLVAYEMCLAKYSLNHSKESFGNIGYATTHFRA